MSERLIIALECDENQPIPWVIWDPANQRPTEAGQIPDAANLNQLAERSKRYPTYVLLPATEILLTEARLPASNRAAREAIPYLLEDQLCEEVEQLHFAVGPVQSEGHYPVAIVAKSLMQRWIDWISTANLRVRALLPDLLALEQAPNALVGLHCGDRILIKTGAFSGFALEPEWLTDWWKQAQGLLQAEGSLKRPLKLFREQQTDPAEIPEGVSSLPLLQPALHKLAQELDPGTILNLLQGPYQLHDPLKEIKRHWRWPGFLLLLILAVQTAGQAWDNHRLSQQRSLIDQQVETLYRQAFPEARRIVNPRTQMKHQLRQLRKGGQGSPFLSQLERILPALSQNPGVTPLGLSYKNDTGILLLDVKATSFKELDSFTTRLNTQGLDSQQGRFRQLEQQVEGQLTIREAP